MAEERTLGSLGMSIPTSMAIESACSVGEFATKPVAPIIKFDTLLVNIRTLCRNAITSYTTAALTSVDSNKIIEDVSEDIEALFSTLEEIAPLVKVELYLCKYSKLNLEFKHANFKNSKTETQMFHEAIERDVIKHFSESKQVLLIEYENRPVAKRRCVIMTHLPLDLLVDGDLVLLESHTGEFKVKTQWGSKINVKKTDPVIPFNISTIQIFGDNKMFLAQPLEIRKLLFKISEKRKWHPLTTYSKMIEDVKMAREPFALQFMLKYK